MRKCINLKESKIDLEKLIECVEEHPILYEGTAKSRYDIDTAWEEVAKQMNERSEVCRVRWSLLRNVYAREIRKVVTKGKTKPWYLAEKMEFCRPYIRHNASKTTKRAEKSIVKDHTTDDNPPRIDDEVYCIEDSVSPHSSPIPYEEFLNIPQEIEPIIPDNIDNNSKSASPPQDFQSYLENSTVNSFKEEEDNFMAFFKTIIPDVVKLQDRNKRIFKQEILSRLNELLDSQESSDMVSVSYNISSPAATAAAVTTRTANHCMYIPDPPRKHRHRSSMETVINNSAINWFSSEVGQPTAATNGTQVKSEDNSIIID